MFDELVDELIEFDNALFKQWAENIPTKIESNLSQCLLKRNVKTKDLQSNFNPQVSCTL